MKAFDLMTALGGIEQELAWETLEFARPGEARARPTRGRRRVRKTLLLAAAISALFVALCAGAYALNWFGVRDAVMGDKIVADRYEQGAYAGKTLDEGTTISYQGYAGSPEYEASREFNAFISIRSQAGSSLGDEEIREYADGIYFAALDKTCALTLPESPPLPTPIPTP